MTQTLAPAVEAHRAAAEPEPAWMDLSTYRPTDYVPGRPLPVRLAWYFVSLLVFESGWVPTSAVKVWLLRLFGAAVGRGVVIKPHVRIKFPWRLTVGNHVWIGEDAWIDDLAAVTLGNHCCLSQGCYLCTGSHDPDDVSFALKTQPIILEDQTWIGARATLLPGVRVHRGGVVAAGSVANRDVPSGIIVAGQPARPIRERQRSSQDVASEC